MIITKERSNPTTSGIKSEVGFSIDPRNLAHVVGLLRDAYSDPITAVLREYAVNGYDAHVEAGTASRPISVTLPTKLEPHLSIRDYGNGLTPEQIENLFCSYGASSKRDSNDYTGCLGIGCKSAFAVTDSFTVTTFHGGKARTYNCYLDESEVGKAALLSEKKFTETGVLVQIPIKREDIDALHAKAAKVFRYFKTKPIVENLSKDWLPTMERPRYGYSGKDWRIVLGRNDEESTDSRVVMGNIAYPIDMEQLSESSQKFLQQDIEIDFNLGELDIAPSREELKYNARTKKALNDRIERLVKEIAENAAIDIGKAPSLWEACKIYRSTFGRGSFGELLKKHHKPVFRKKALQDAIIRLPSTDAKRREQGLEVFSLSKLRWARRGKHYQLLDGQDYLDPNPNDKVYLDKSSGPRDWSGRIRTLVNSSGFNHAYIVRSRNGGIDWLVSQDPDFKDIPFEDFEKVAVTPPDPSDSKVGGTKDRETCAKHSRESFVLNEKMFGSWQRIKSRYWEQQSVDLDEGGVYLPIENFKISNKVGAPSCPSDYRQKIEFCRKHLGLTGKIYGFKKEIVAKVKKDKGWVTFDKKMIELFAAKGEDWMSDLFKLSDYLEGYDKQFGHMHGTLINHSTPETPAKIFGDALAYVGKLRSRILDLAVGFRDACGRYSGNRQETLDLVFKHLGVKPPEKFDQLRSKFTSAYPMAKDWQRSSRDDNEWFADDTTESKTSKVKALALANYVTLIDEQNKQNKKG